MTLCRRNCHVDPHKIETCFRTFPKFKLTNAPHFHLMQNRRRIRAGYSPHSFFKAIVVHKTGCALTAIMLSAQGPRHTVNITENSSSSRKSHVAAQIILL